MRKWQCDAETVAAVATETVKVGVSGDAGGGGEGGVATEVDAKVGVRGSSKQDSANRKEHPRSDFFRFKSNAKKSPESYGFKRNSGDFIWKYWQPYFSWQPNFCGLQNRALKDVS